MIKIKHKHLPKNPENISVDLNQKQLEQLAEKHMAELLAKQHKSPDSENDVTFFQIS